MSLSSKAMLVALSINLWTARKVDKKATKTVADRHKVEKGMGKYNKYLVNPDAESFDAVQTLGGEARDWHYAHTLPWVHKGAQLLPAAAYLDYRVQMQQFAERFEQAVEKFIDEYPTLKAQAQKKLNGLFNEAEYPSVKELRRKYGFDFSFLPVPDAGDFRVDVGNQDVQRIKSQINSQVRDATAEAMKDLWTRLRKPVVNMAAALADPDKRFHDTLVDNLKEVIEVLPTLNLTDDPDLKAICEEVKKGLIKVSPQTLRDDEDKRAATAKRAREIAEKMSAFCT